MSDIAVTEDVPLPHEWIRDSIRPLLDEIDERLEGELSTADRVAILAAVGKAAYAGFFVGAATFAEATSGHSPVVLQYAEPYDPSDYDEWARRYGEPEGSSA